MGRSIDERGMRAGPQRPGNFQFYDDACLPAAASHAAGMEINAVTLGVRRTDPGTHSQQ